MPASAKAGYHHGDLRASLLTTAMRMLEAGEPFSLRALAREAGVSPTAPYRHFKDRDALESALAAQGLRDLKADLIEGRALPASAADLGELAVVTVVDGSLVTGQNPGSAKETATKVAALL